MAIISTYSQMATTAYKYLTNQQPIHASMAYNSDFVDICPALLHSRTGVITGCAFVALCGVLGTFLPEGRSRKIPKWGCVLGATAATAGMAYLFFHANDIRICVQAIAPHNRFKDL